MLKQFLKSGYFVGMAGIALQGVVGNILQANGSDIPMSVNIIYDIVLVAVSFYLIVRKGV
jgi:hypothetical protein